MITAQDKRIILGVSHLPETIDDTIEKIKSYSPRSIGLELREDYKKMQREGFRTDFFSDIADFGERNSIKVIPLENPDFVEEMHALARTREVVFGRISKEHYENKILKIIGTIESGYVAPENIFELKRFFGIYQNTLNLIERCGTPEKIDEAMKDLNRRRENYFVKKVESENPEMVIIGMGHLKAMQEKLPERPVDYVL